MEEDDDPELVMAIPRRELYALRGFIKDISVAVISCLADESWFATTESIAADVDSKEVRLGVVVRKEDDILVDPEGIGVFVVPVTHSATSLGPGLRALKELARIAGESLVKTDCHSVEMRGYYNDDTNEEMRPYLVVIYEVRCHPEVELEEGLEWMEILDVGREPLDEVSTQVLSELYEE